MSKRIDDFQKFVSEKDVTSSTSKEIQIYHSLFGLSSEVGELMDLYEKNLRLSATKHLIDENDILSELGDVLWYLTNLINLHGFSLQHVIDANMKKLKERSNTKEK